MTNQPNSRKANIVVQDLENEVLIYDLNINKAFCLNQTAGLVYQLCDGKRTVAEISDLMSKELKILVSEDFVWLALDGLRKDNLLKNANELANHFGGLTRREAVKRVGLASMVMLPLISSVVAPNAAMAASGGSALFGTCIVNVPNSCAPGLSCIFGCIGGNCSGPACCTRFTADPLFGSGYSSCVEDQAGCNGFFASRCCSGTATFSSTPCPGLPTFGICTCD